MKLSKKAKKHVETANKAFEGAKASMKIYEKNYFNNKDGNKNENNRSIEENPDKNDPQIHSDNME